MSNKKYEQRPVSSWVIKSARKDLLKRYPALKYMPRLTFGKTFGKKRKTYDQKFFDRIIQKLIRDQTKK